MTRLIKSFALLGLAMMAAPTLAGSLGGTLGDGTTSGGYSSTTVYSNCSSVGDSTAGTSLGGSLGNVSGSGALDCANEDTDGDRMQNSWEQTYSLNKYAATDAYGDSDSDGVTNQHEAAQGSKASGSGSTDSDGDGVPDGDDPEPTNASVTSLTVDGTYKGGSHAQSGQAQ